MANQTDRVTALMAKIQECEREADLLGLDLVAHLLSIPPSSSLYPFAFRKPFIRCCRSLSRCSTRIALK